MSYGTSARVPIYAEIAVAPLRVRGWVGMDWCCHTHLACKPNKTATAFELLPITLGILLAIRRYAFHRSLVLAADELLLPTGFFRLHVVRVPYVSIDRVWRFTLLGMAVICVKTSKGKFEIPSTMLPDVASYLAIEEFLIAKAEQNAGRRRNDC
jgi:hypothetical protein